MQNYDEIMNLYYDLFPEKTTVQDSPKLCKCQDTEEMVLTHGFNACSNCGVVLFNHQDNIDYSSSIATRGHYKGYTRVHYFVIKLRWLCGDKCMRETTEHKVIEKIKNATTDYSFQNLLKTMTKLKLRSYINYIYRIYEILNHSRAVIIISKAEEKQLVDLFKVIEEEYYEIVNEDRKNFFLYNYLFYKLFAMIGRNDVLQYLPLFKNKKTLMKQEKLFEKICSNLGIKFEPIQIEK